MSKRLISFLLFCLAGWSPAIALGAPSFVPETQFSNLDRGPASLARAPGSTVFLEDREIHLELSWQDEFKLRRAFQGYALVPLGGLALSVGYQPFLWQGVLWHRSSLGLATHLSPSLGLGLAVNEFRRGEDKAELSYDWGLFWEPTNWLNLNLSQQNANRAMIAGANLDETWHLGIGLRPLFGQNSLTFVGETVWQNSQEWALAEQRWGFDVRIVPGVHLRMAYVPERQRVDMGIYTALNKAHVGFLAGMDGEETTQNLALKISGKSSESILSPAQQTESLKLMGNLQKEEESLFFENSTFAAHALRIQQLVNQNRLKKLRLLLDHIDVGSAQIEELRAAIKALRKNGVRVEAEIIGGDEKTYLVAAACDHISMDSVGALVLDGHFSEDYYFADTLRKFGLRFESVAVGTHKTAPQSLTHNKASKEEKETRKELLSFRQAKLEEALKQDRSLTAESVEKVFSAGLFTAQQAKEVKLIDAISGAGKAHPIAPEKREPYAWDLSTYKTVLWGAKDRIAIVPVRGLITRFAGQSPLGGPSVSAEKLVPILDDLADNIDISAVILRLDSPGGDVLASEQIWRAARRLAQEKPLIASMGNVAASGAYYIASAAHHIFALPTTVTGSIGIFAMRLDFAGLLAKLEVGREELKTGEFSDWQSMGKPWSDGAKSRVQAYLKAHYSTFLDRVAFGRKLPMPRIEELAEGRIYSGDAAFRNGLVDSLGGLVESLRLAKEKLGADQAQKIEIWTPNRYDSWMQNVGVLGQRNIGSGFVLRDFQKRLGAFENTYWAVLPEYFDL